MAGTSLPDGVGTARTPDRAGNARSTPWSYRSPAAPDEVWPTRVIGSSVAHLSTVELDDDGGRHRAICPAADSMGPLELIPDDAVIVWCGACRAWAADVGLELPRGR